MKRLILLAFFVSTLAHADDDQAEKLVASCTKLDEISYKLYITSEKPGEGREIATGYIIVGKSDTKIPASFEKSVIADIAVTAKFTQDGEKLTVLVLRDKWDNGYFKGMLMAKAYNEPLNCKLVER